MLEYMMKNKNTTSIGYESFSLLCRKGRIYKDIFVNKINYYNSKFTISVYLFQMNSKIISTLSVSERVGKKS